MIINQGNFANLFFSRFVEIVGKPNEAEYKKAVFKIRVLNTENLQEKAQAINSAIKATLFNNALTTLLDRKPLVKTEFVLNSPKDLTRLNSRISNFVGDTIVKLKEEITGISVLNFPHIFIGTGLSLRYVGILSLYENRFVRVPDIRLEKKIIIGLNPDANYFGTTYFKREDNTIYFKHEINSDYLAVIETM